MKKSLYEKVAVKKGGKIKEEAKNSKSRCASMFQEETSLKKVIEIIKKRAPGGRTTVRGSDHPVIRPLKSPEGKLPLSAARWLKTDCF